MATLDELRSATNSAMDNVRYSAGCLQTCEAFMLSELPIGVTANDINRLQTHLTHHLDQAAKNFWHADNTLREGLKAAGERFRKPTSKQMALLQVARRELALHDGLYRGVLFWFGGSVESASDLDNHGFDQVMRYMGKLGFRSTKEEAKAKRETFGKRAAMATPSQVDLLRSLWMDYASDPMAKGDEDLNAWLEKFFHVSALRFVDKVTAGKAITALRRMVSRKSDKQVG